MDILMDQNSRTYVVLMIIASVLAVVVWKVVEGFDAGVVAPLSNTVNVAEHVGGEENIVDHGPHLVAAISNSDTGKQMINPYYEKEEDKEDKEDLNCEGSDLEEAWNPIA